MKRIIPFLLLPFVIAACHDGSTMPSDGAELAKGGKPGQPRTEYDFQYAWVDQELGSDCWRPRYGDSDTEPPPGYDYDYGDPIPRTIWCNGPDPAFAMLVLQVDADGLRTPVTGGTVTFNRCVDTRTDDPVTWTYCGTIAGRRGGKARFYKAVDYQQVTVAANGIALITLAGWDGTSLWGMAWGYDSGDGKKLEAEEHWFDFGWVGYDGGPG
jgi:hypothetical protein